MNTRQEAFLAMNRHLIPDPDLDLGDETILCRDLGTDINGEHFGPYTLDKFCHLRAYRGLAATTPSEYHIHQHIFDNIRVNDKVRMIIRSKSDTYNPIDGDWLIVVYTQLRSGDSEDKILLEDEHGEWVIVYRQYYPETPQLMTADF